MNAEIRGLQVHYEDTGGNGTPVVFLHGFPLDHTIWRHQVSALQKDHRVITPDLRGHGGSEAPPSVYTMDDLAEDLHQLLTQLNCGPVILGGHSMGGYITFAFYRKFSAKVKGLVLISTRAGADTPEGKAGRESLAKKVEHEGIRAVVDRMLPNMIAEDSADRVAGLRSEVESMMANTSTNGLTGSLRGMVMRRDSTDLLPNITVPVLIIAGTADKLIPYSESENMAKAIPNATLHLIEGVGHLPSLEKPDEFSVVLKNWLLRQNDFSAE